MSNLNHVCFKDKFWKEKLNDLSCKIVFFVFEIDLLSLWFWLNEQSWFDACKTWKSVSYVENATITCQWWKWMYE